MTKTRLVAVLLGAACAAGLARTPEFGEYREVQESLRPQTENTNRAGLT